mmetsp:Transcript_2133/g.4130  ORF Transcript_2133/g.4130 Transcript_2133/m.4130 type:complete len:234 (-) Transcript_2133:1372-2073(-)
MFIVTRVRCVSIRTNSASDAHSITSTHCEDPTRLRLHHHCCMTVKCREIASMPNKHMHQHNHHHLLHIKLRLVFLALVANRRLFILAQNAFTSDTRLFFHHKRHHRAHVGRRYFNDTRVRSMKQLLHALLAKNRFKDTRQWLFQLVLEIVLCIHRDTILERKQRIFRLLVRFRFLAAFDDDITHAITHFVRFDIATLAHSKHQFRVRRFHFIILNLVEFLGHNERTQINLVLQ